MVAVMYSIGVSGEPCWSVCGSDFSALSLLLCENVHSFVSVCRSLPYASGHFH